MSKRVPKADRMYVCTDKWGYVTSDCPMEGAMVRFCSTLLLYVLLAVLAGCVVIPIPTKEHGLITGRGQIPAEDVTFLENGKTSREEVLLKFGEPSLVLNNQKTLVYRWTVSAGGYIGVVVMPMAAAPMGGDVTKDYLVILEFDGEGRLVRFERSGGMGSSLSRINKWIPAENEKLSTTRTIGISPVAVPKAESSISDVSAKGGRIQVGEFSDQRKEGGGLLIGRMKGLGVIHMADVLMRQNPVDVVREALSSQFAEMGWQPTDKSPDLIVTGELHSFAITTSHRYMLWFELTGSLDCALMVKRTSAAGPGTTKNYHAKCTRRSVLPPDENDFSTVMRECLEDFQQQVCSDPYFVNILNGSNAP